MNTDSNYANTPYFQYLPRTEVKTDQLFISRLQTPFSDLLAGVTQKGLCLLEFTDTNRVDTQISLIKKSYQSQIKIGSTLLFDQLNQQLTNYFSGTLKDFTIPLDIIGTDFQKQAWDALLSIPYGETRSYQQQAEAMNHPNAVRAVANANRSNKIGILIPCHRVIGKNGNMTGYGGGLWRKQYLIDLEAGLNPLSKR